MQDSAILVAHPADLTRLGMQTVLSQIPRFRVDASVHTLGHLLQALHEHPTKVVIFDQHLDPECDAIAILRRLNRIVPLTAPILLGTVQNGLFIRDILAAGARGYLLNSDDLRDCLPLAVETVAAKGLYLSPTANTEYLLAMQSEDRHWRIDPEAHAVLRLLANGEHIREIALRLNIAPRRAYWIREKLRKRFQANTNEHLISRAVAEGLASPT